MLTGMVRAEEQLASGLELDTEVGLSSATVAAVRSSQLGTGNGSGHIGLISRSVGDRCNVVAGLKIPQELCRLPPSIQPLVLRVVHRHFRAAERHCPGTQFDD